jgi:hypothetical protein
LKTNAKQLAESLSNFFQSSIDQGKIPDDWKEALVIHLLSRVHTFCDVVDDDKQLTFTRS